jgi:hypothetical protein
VTGESSLNSLFFSLLLKSDTFFLSLDSGDYYDTVNVLKLDVNLIISFFKSAISFNVLDVTSYYYFFSVVYSNNSFNPMSLLFSDLSLSIIVDSLHLFLLSSSNNSYSLLLTSSLTLLNSSSYLPLSLSATSFCSFTSLSSLTDSPNLPLIRSLSLSYLALNCSNCSTRLLRSDLSSSCFYSLSCLSLVSRASLRTSSPIFALSSGQSYWRRAPEEVSLRGLVGLLGDLEEWC